MRIHILFRIAHELLVNKKTREIKRHLNLNKDKIKLEYIGKNRKFKIVKLININKGHIIEFRLDKEGVIECFSLIYKNQHIHDKAEIEAMMNKGF